MVVTRLLRVFEIANVPDEGYRATVGSNAATFYLIVFVVRDEPFLVFGVEDPSLVSVGGSLVGSDGDGLGELLVGNIICACVSVRFANNIRQSGGLQMVRESSL